MACSDDSASSQDSGAHDVADGSVDGDVEPDTPDDIDLDSPDLDAASDADASDDGDPSVDRDLGDDGDDAGQDAALDPPVETSDDASLDPPTDSAFDSDATPDAALDGDATLDGDAALDPELGTDADAGGATWNGLPEFDWDFCPGADTYVGDDGWPWSLEVTSDAIYCKMFEDVDWACCEGPIEPIIPFTQPERWNDRFELRVVAGTYPVPESDDPLPIRLPVCLQFADGRQGVTSMSVMGSALGTTDSGNRTITIDQPLLVGESPWTAYTYLYAEDGAPLVLDGSQSFFSASSLRGDRDDPYYGVQSCTHDDAWRDLRTTLTLDRGELVLHTRLGQSPASTEPGVFYQAEGTLDGVAFSQSDRWHLWYEVQHHHFVQYYLVLFSRNIGDVCGLEVLNAVLFEGDLSEDLRVYEVACAGLDPPTFPLGETLEVTAYSIVNEAE